MMRLVWKCLVVIVILLPNLSSFVGAESNPVPKLGNPSFPSSLIVGQEGIIVLSATNAGSDSQEGDLHVAFPGQVNRSIILSTSGDAGQVYILQKGDFFNGCNYGGAGCEAQYASVVAVQTPWTNGLVRTVSVSVRPQLVGRLTFETKITMQAQGRWLGDPSENNTNFPLDHQGERVARFTIDVLPLPSIRNLQITNNFDQLLSQTTLIESFYGELGINVIIDDTIKIVLDNEKNVSKVEAVA